jgi:hypothetical protein
LKQFSISSIQYDAYTMALVKQLQKEILLNEYEIRRDPNQ